MGSVRSESSHPFECGFESQQHIVQGLRQLAEFVVRSGNRNPFGQISLADALGCLRYAENRQHGTCAQPVSSRSSNDQNKGNARHADPQYPGEDCRDRCYV